MVCQMWDHGYSISFLSGRKQGGCSNRNGVPTGRNNTIYQKYLVQWIQQWNICGMTETMEADMWHRYDNKDGGVIDTG